MAKTRLRDIPDEFIEITMEDGRTLPVRVVVNPSATRVVVRIDPTRRQAVAVAPSRRHTARATAFAAERANWIARQLDDLPTLHPFSPGGVIPVRGVEHRLTMDKGRAPARLERGGLLLAGAPDADTFAGRVRRFLIAEARADFARRVAAHAAALKVSPKKILIKDTKTRWGSCTADGVLAFSWRLIMAPPYVLDYLAAHETAHLAELNHSPRFWSLVRRVTPDHLRARSWLRRFGATLHAYGVVE